MFSRRKRKASEKRLRTQEGNALDTIAFACWAELFMHGSHFLLLLEICQSFQMFQPLLEAVLWAAYIPRCSWSQLQPKTCTKPPLCLSHAYTHVRTHRVWGTNSHPTTSSLPSPHPFPFLSPSTSTGFQPISPGLLSSSTRQQMDSERRNCAETNT